MTFEWDAAKSTRNLSLRGFDFEFASLVFSGTYIEFDDTRRDYGECQLVALGLADDIRRPSTLPIASSKVACCAASSMLDSVNGRRRRYYAEILEARSHGRRAGARAGLISHDFVASQRQRSDGRRRGSFVISPKRHGREPVWSRRKRSKPFLSG